MSMNQPPKQRVNLYACVYTNNVEMKQSRTKAVSASSYDMEK